MPLANDSKPLIASLALDGLFRYKVLPMGLSSEPAAWQKFMAHAVTGIDGQVAYLDDGCVFELTPEEHDERLLKVLHRLSGLHLRLNKRNAVLTLLKFNL